MEKNNFGLKTMLLKNVKEGLFKKKPQLISRLNVANC